MNSNSCGEPVFQKELLEKWVDATSIPPNIFSGAIGQMQGVTFHEMSGNVEATIISLIAKWHELRLKLAKILNKPSNSPTVDAAIKLFEVNYKKEEGMQKRFDMMNEEQLKKELELYRVMDKDRITIEQIKEAVERLKKAPQIIPNVPADPYGPMTSPPPSNPNSPSWPYPGGSGDMKPWTVTYESSANSNKFSIPDEYKKYIKNTL